MLKRTLVALSVLALSGCLDFFGADEPHGDEDGDDADAGDTGGPAGGSNGGGTGGTSNAGTGATPTGGVNNGGSDAGSSSGGSNVGGSTNTGGDAPGGGTGGAGMGGATTGGTIGFAGKAGSGGGGAATGGSATGGAGTGGGGRGGTGGGGAAGKGGTGGSAGTCATEELLLNPSFDLGDTDWEVSSYNWTTLIVNQSTAGVAPQSGTWLGRLGGYDYAEDILAQFIEIPPSATNIVLSFYEQVSTTWVDEYPYDLMAVGVFDGVTGDSFGDYALSNADAHTGWVRHQVSIDPAAAGMYVIVASLVYGYYGADYSTLYVDTLSLQARVCR